MAANFIYFLIGFKFWEWFGHHVGGDVYVFDLIDLVICIKFLFGYLAICEVVTIVESRMLYLTCERCWLIVFICDGDMVAYLASNFEVSICCSSHTEYFRVKGQKDVTMWEYWNMVFTKYSYWRERVVSRFFHFVATFFYIIYIRNTNMSLVALPKSWLWLPSWREFQESGQF